jgi:xanthine dehydrogenase small subunit
MDALRSEFQPISDMRASASYRREVLGNLLERFWHETQYPEEPMLQGLSFSGSVS